MIDEILFLQFIERQVQTFEKLMEFLLSLALVALTAAIAIATYFLSKYTKDLANETKLLRKAQTEPLISLYIAADSHFLRIETRNVGQGPAYKLEYEIKDNIEIYDRKHLTDMNILKNISYLAPMQKVSYELATYHEVQGKSFRIIVKYQNKYKEPFYEEFNLDVGELEGSLMSEASAERSLSRIADSVSRMDSKMESPLSNRLISRIKGQDPESSSG